ncbi:MAG: ankyrin repeat domain-containing protein [Acidobacteria bacterium]|nr:ankyrin repeat domain-containing protein [Acidobacteriota bacterium]
MYQPEALNTSDYLPWSRGRGLDVWAMLQAAHAGDVRKLQSLAARTPALLTCEFQYHTPLHFAVQENRFDAASFLLRAGALPKTGPGVPPTLPLAAARGYTAIVHLLENHLLQRFHICPQGDEVAALIRTRTLPEILSALQSDSSLIHAADHRGNQPIHWAVLTRQLPLIDFLLQHGADINHQRTDGAAPIHLTAGDYHFRAWREIPHAHTPSPRDLARLLIERGAYYDLSTAAWLNDLPRIRALLDADPALVNQVPPYTAYHSGLALRSAACAGHIDAVRLLLERGADPNIPEPIAPFGGALREAVDTGSLELVQLLLDHGANPSSATESSGNALWAAKSSPEISALLAARGATIPLDIACYDGDLDLIAASADPITEEAFFNALSEGHQPAVELLLSRRPGLITVAPTGSAATPELAAWLLRRGADPNHRNWLGATQLHAAAARGHLELARTLLHHGADPTLLNEDWAELPSATAARHGHLQLAEFLAP